jgi:hypothetical protein
MTSGKKVKVYVFPVGSVEVQLLAKDEFDRIVEEGKKKGHTHCQFVCVGYCDRVVSFDSAVFKAMSENLEGWNVCAVKTGFPFYKNSNRFRYDPDVVGVTEKENNSFGHGLLRFIMN